MPIYRYRCPQGHYQDLFLTVSNHQATMACPCGQVAGQVITAPLMVKVAQDVCYDSPIDGTPITSWAAREEDLKRNQCRPYDPEMKKDAERFRQQQDQELDAAIDTAVEETITKMPTAQRGKLYSELTEQGVSLEYARSTVEP